ncbi:RING finger [Trichophyton interdigitale]|nr:RING finger [Trichophyton interdigitale]KAG5217101.1 RING finger [Trichophyton interdigitale]KAG8207262.1 RING finger [Trichophyton interdigitale]
MAQDVEGSRDVLCKMIADVHRGDQDEEDECKPCVICLDKIEEICIAIPCKHSNFDLQCLLIWLGQRPACPLCQTAVTGVKYDIHAPDGEKIIWIPTSPPAAKKENIHGLRSRNRRRSRQQAPRSSHGDLDSALLRRRHIYRHQLYSLRVGSSRRTGYREVTPRMIDRDEKLLSRARRWIRRELQVFTFLNLPEAERQVDGAVRIGNPEYLLEYIVAVIRTVDIKGSAGQAEMMLRDFLGREYACLFLHELQSWLRSPFETLREWDAAVQYDESGIS